MIYGVSNHSPCNILALIQKRKLIISNADVCILPSKKLLSKSKPKFSALFILSFNDMRANLEILNSRNYANIKVFVFDSALSLVRVEGIVPLDYSCVSSNDCMSFKYHAVNVLNFKFKSDLPIKIHNIDYIKSMIEVVCRNSLLLPLMTVIYKLGNLHQKIAKIAFGTSLKFGKDSKYLHAKCLEGGLSKNAADAFVSLYDNDLCTPYKEAFAVLRANKLINIQALCAEFKIAEYEFQYLMTATDEKKKKVGEIKK